MSEIIIATETAEKQNGEEEAERKKIAGMAVTKIATEWNRLEKLDEKLRNSFIQVELSCSPLQGSYLDKLIKNKMISLFGWKKNSFGIETIYSKRTEKLFVIVDLFT
ncbi:hypothetical protein KAI56_00050 [Candidatus Parcubacteria bacterium]|nr:hypothetical protein [Candidatus Parcubacteria bacterium]